MPIPFTCPHCGHFSSVAEEYAGQTGPCAKCGQSITIQRPGASTATAVAAPRKSNATTIIIILVVVVVGLLMCAGLLAALMIPAVTAAREAADRTQAQNNARQVMLGLHIYHDTHNQLPVGTVVNEDLAPEERLSWMVEILPYMEQDHIYGQIDQQQAWDSPANWPSTTTWVPSYQTELDENLSLEMTDFVGIAGVGLDAAELPKEDPAAGVFGYDRQIRLADVTDGTSTTFALFETHRKNGPWAQGGPSTVRGINLNDVPIIGEGRQFGREQGAIFGRLDASVQILSPEANPEVLEAGATIHGGEAVIWP